MIPVFFNKCPLAVLIINQLAHMPSIFQAYAKHMPSVMLHVRHSLGTCTIFLGSHVAGQCLIEYAWNEKHMPNICQAHAKHMPSLFQAYSKHMPSLFQAYSKHMPSLFQALSRHMPSLFQTYSKHMPNIFQAYAKRNASR